MSSPPLQARRHESGSTIVEVAVTAGIVAIVLQALVSSSIAMSNSSDFGHKRFELVAKADRVMDAMVSELQLTSTTMLDPVTQQPYVEIAGDAGSRSITFRRMVGLAENGSEVLGLWTTPIEYQLNQGLLTRSQDGVTDVVARRVQSLDFELDVAGRLRVQVSVWANRTRSAQDSMTRSRIVDTM